MNLLSAVRPRGQEGRHIAWIARAQSSDNLQYFQNKDCTLDKDLKIMNQTNYNIVKILQLQFLYPPLQMLSTYLNAELSMEDKYTTIFKINPKQQQKYLKELYEALCESYIIIIEPPLKQQLKLTLSIKNYLHTVQIQ
ncbi:Hypothetical_protein [Hexamita inflata]|uniref:Hypothetical_protein n=1 Tax=Hexamita inflata TaxID=28002 RepID=A0ABP1JU11_9EUKA